MVGCPRPNRWLVEPDSTGGFTQRALVRMKKERAKTFISKDKNGLSVARSLYVSLDRADNVIEAGPSFAHEDVFRVPCPRFLWAGLLFERTGIRILLSTQY